MRGACWTSLLEKEMVRGEREDEMEEISPVKVRAAPARRHCQAGSQGGAKRQKTGGESSRGVHSLNLVPARKGGSVWHVKVSSTHPCLRSQVSQPPAREEEREVEREWPRMGRDAIDRLGPGKASEDLDLPLSASRRSPSACPTLPSTFILFSQRNSSRMSMENAKHQATRAQVFAVVAFYMVAALVVRILRVSCFSPRFLQWADFSLSCSLPDGHGVRPSLLLSALLLFGAASLLPFLAAGPPYSLLAACRTRPSGSTSD